MIFRFPARKLKSVSVTSPPVSVTSPSREVPPVTPPPVKKRKPKTKPPALTFDPTSLTEHVKAARARGLDRLTFTRRDFDLHTIDPTAFLWEPQKRAVEPTFWFWYIRMAVHLVG